MENRKYSDYERQQIAEKEYDAYSVGNTIRINKDSDVVGYISEVKNKLSGENTYIVTDVKLPENPTKDDLSKVRYVTVLYQGSTFDILGNPIGTAKDWILNNLSMTVRVLVPDSVPTRPTIQMRDSSHSLKEVLDKYPNAIFSLYGHSLGSMNGQVAISDVPAEYDHRISGLYLYNGPNTYKTLSEEQRKNVDRLYYKIFNYVDTHDFIGLGYGKEPSVGNECTR